MMYRDRGPTPPNDRAPELPTSEALRAPTTTAGLVYHTPTPTSYPRQYLRRGRSGWVLTVLDGWGRRISRTCTTRSEALDLLAVVGRLGFCAADTVIGGVR